MISMQFRLFALVFLTACPATHETSFVVYPADCNANGTLFGGKIMSEMDRCAGIAARRFLYGSSAKDAVTIGVDRLVFHKAAKTKDLIFVSAEITKVGEKTIAMSVKVERETGDGKRERIADGLFTYCAVDLATGKSIAHGKKIEGGIK